MTSCRTPRTQLLPAWGAPPGTRATSTPGGISRGVPIGTLALAAILLGGCQLTPTAIAPDALGGIESDLSELEALVSSTRDELKQLTSEQSDQLDGVSKQLRRIDGDVSRVPELIASACPGVPEVTTQRCEDVAVKTVVTQDDKMIVGSTEHLWISPPGIHLTGSIDTGASSNTIHATDVTPFERDGDNWVRFTLASGAPRNADAPKKGASDSTAGAVVVERKIVRLLRTSKRPVVRLRVKLGNVLDSFDFILSDRSGNDHAVQLGRNFLQDVALVDVGKQFVQPRFEESNRTPDTDDSPAPQ